MKRLSIPLRAALALLTIIVMTACVPGEPTPSPEEIASAIETAVAKTVEAQGQVATSVALTVAAREAEADAEAAADVSEEPAATETPIPTITPVMPTATPITISSGGSSGGGGGGSTATYAYSCDIVHQRPIDNTVFKPNKPFDVRFGILNTGTKTWLKGQDLVLINDSGNALVAAFAMMELPNDLAPGEIWDVGPFDAFSPSNEGFYVISFKLQMEGGDCLPYVAFKVEK